MKTVKGSLGRLFDHSITRKSTSSLDYYKNAKTRELPNKPLGCLGKGIEKPVKFGLFNKGRTKEVFVKDLIIKRGKKFTRKVHRASENDSKRTLCKNYSKPLQTKVYPKKLG